MASTAVRRSRVSGSVHSVIPFLAACAVDGEHLDHGFYYELGAMERAKDFIDNELPNL